MKVLWVKSGGLVPLDTGGKIRSFSLLKELARKQEITLFTFYGSHPGDSHVQLEKYFARVVCVPLNLPRPRGTAEALDYARNLLSLQPYTLAKYCRPEVSRALRQLLEAEKFDVMVCDFLFSAGAIPWDWPCSKVLFTHNVEEQIWRRHFQVSRNPFWKAACWREFQTMRFAERHYIRQADHVLAVSENDRGFFASYVDPDKITVIPTGVDVECFRPAAEPEEPNRLVFTGSMDWMPNEDAILYFVREILPRIRQEIPKVELWVVGRDPTERLQALGARDAGVRITGTVDDIRPYVWRSPVYVVPLRIGGGTRIKIFEAMAMGKAVVSTSIGAEGLPVEHDANIVLADEPGEFARRVVSLLRDPAEREKLGGAARELVEQNFSWAAVSTEFDAVLSKVARSEARPLAEQLSARRAH